MKRRGVLGGVMGSALGGALGSMSAWAASVDGAESTAFAGVRLPVALEGQPYRLVKDWDFVNGMRDLNAMRREFFTRYVYANGSLDFLNDEWQRYRDADNHVFVDEGLALVAREVNGLRPGGIHSGMLRSRWTGKHGYFEAVLKVPPGRGLWPAFWLNPQDGVWPPEIDVMEIVNNGRDTTRNSFHFVHGNGPRATKVLFSRLDKHGSYRPGGDFSDGFHRFAVEWLPDRVRHFVDDVLVVDRQYAWEHKDGSDAGHAHVLLNLAVGGKWPGPPDASTQLPASLLVRSIRVWQK